MSIGKPMSMGKISKLDTMLQVGRTFGMRDGMLRLQYELQRGSGLMSWRMRSVQGWDSWDLKRIAPSVQGGRTAGCTPGWHAADFSLPTPKPWG